MGRLVNNTTLFLAIRVNYRIRENQIGTLYVYDEVEQR